MLYLTINSECLWKMLFEFYDTYNIVVLAMLPDYGRCTKLKQTSYNEFQQSNSAASVDSTCSNSNQRYNDVTSVKPNVNLGL